MCYCPTHGAIQRLDGTRCYCGSGPHPCKLCQPPQRIPVTAATQRAITRPAPNWRL